MRRNATAIYQDLVDRFCFAGAHGSVKRFVARLRQRQPEQFDRLPATSVARLQLTSNVRADAYNSAIAISALSPNRNANGRGSLELFTYIW